MLHRIIYLAIIALLACTPGKAQVDTIVADTTDPLAGFRIRYDNDVLNSTDYYYTEGLRLEFALPYLRRTFVSALLLRLPDGSDERIGLSLNQDCFTPRTLSSDSLLIGDRPFAGALYLGMFRNSVNPRARERLSSELSVGVVGSCALCAETQANAHALLDNSYPEGWQNQIGNGPILNYQVIFEQGLITTPAFDFSAYGLANAGTLYTNGGLGVTMRIGLLDEHFAMMDPKQRFAVYLVGSAEGRAVAYDATLQGPVMSGRSIYRLSASEIERVVGRAEAGLSMRYRHWDLGYRNIWIGPEFSGAITHSWGQVALGFHY